MRTTISLDDRLAKQVRRRAEAEGLSVSAFIGKTLNEALKVQKPLEVRPFRLITVGGGGPLPGVDLDRPRSLEVAEDEAEIVPEAVRGRGDRQRSAR
jgi:hypothetical protein